MDTQRCLQDRPGTIYDNLKELLKLDLVEECPGVADGRRRCHLTDLGNAVLSAEIERPSSVLMEARRALRLHEEKQP